MYRIIIIFTLFFPVTLFGQSFEVISSTSFRAKASSQSTVYTRVKAGDKGDVLLKGQWWTKVKFKGKEGYLKTAKLKFFSDPNVIEQPQSESKSKAPDNLYHVESARDNNSVEKDMELRRAQNVIQQQKNVIDRMEVLNRSITKQLNETKANLQELETTLYFKNLEIASIQNELNNSKENLVLTEKKNQTISPSIKTLKKSFGITRNKGVIMEKRKAWSIGLGVVNPYMNESGLDINGVSPIILSLEKGINDKMSWGMGAHLGYGKYTTFGGDTRFANYSFFGKYYYHFMPRDSRFDLAGVGSIGYRGAAFFTEALDTGSAGDFKIGISGLARLRLGKGFAIYSEVGFNEMVGNIQVGISYGRM